MALTAAQNALIKAAILADGALSGLPSDGNSLGIIADALNAPSSAPVVNGWRTDAQVVDIFDTVTWANYTPNDTPLSSDLPAISAAFLNRASMINIKQMNLQNMLVGRTTIDASKTNIRAGLRDAVIQIPSGAAGAMVSAGGSSGVTVLTACLRVMRRIEAILKSPDATTGTVTAGIFDFQGTITPNEVDTARRS